MPRRKRLSPTAKCSEVLRAPHLKSLRQRFAMQGAKGGGLEGRQSDLSSFIPQTISQMTGPELPLGAGRGGGCKTQQAVW